MTFITVCCIFFQLMNQLQTSMLKTTRVKSGLSRRITLCHFILFRSIPPFWRWAFPTNVKSCVTSDRIYVQTILVWIHRLMSSVLAPILFSESCAWNWLVIWPLLLSNKPVNWWRLFDKNCAGEVLNLAHILHPSSAQTLSPGLYKFQWSSTVYIMYDKNTYTPLFTSIPGAAWLFLNTPLLSLLFNKHTWDPIHQQQHRCLIAMQGPQHYRVPYHKLVWSVLYR